VDIWAKDASPDFSRARSGRSEIAHEASDIIRASDAVGDAGKIDQLASRLMLRLETCQGGRAFGLEVVARLRLEAQRLGFEPQARPKRRV
jgi:hypothetical protein